MARLENGSVVGAFQIGGFVGQGAFGITYLAYHRTLKYPIALKEFFPRDICFRRENGSLTVADVTEIEEYEIEKKSFLAEAEALTPFRHEANIVTILDIIEANGTWYIVMEYIEGQSLSEWVGKGAEMELASGSETRFLLQRLLGALKTLHAQDPPLLHRDIKPGNIMISADSGEPILIDFGAARKASLRGSRKLSTILTPGYAPYEQYDLTEEELDATFADVDKDSIASLPPQSAASDIYSLGATAYFMLSGRPPPDALLRRSNTAQFRPLSDVARGKADPELLASVDRALKIEPQDRFGSAQDWLDHLASMESPRTVAPSSEQTVEPTTGTDPTQTPVSTNDAPSDSSYEADPSESITIEREEWTEEPATSRLTIRDRPDSTKRMDILPSTHTGPISRGPKTTPEPTREQSASRAGLWVGSLAAILALGAGAGFFVYGGNDQSAASSSQTYTEEQGLEDAIAVGVPFRDCDDCPDMVRLPAGEFTMGSGPEEEGHQDNESPQRTIAFRHSFALSRDEVTVDNWRACVNGGGCSSAPLERASVNQGGLPVTYVTWFAAKAYTSWLSESTGIDYRLPSEAEWEYGARAGTDTAYPWSEGPVANCEGCLSGEGGLISGEAAQSNAYGLANMAGNVWEWTEDCYQETLAAKPSDGRPVNQPVCETRSIRGGSFANPLETMRSARRTGIEPDAGGDSLGFRVARDVDASERATGE